MFVAVCRIHYSNLTFSSADLQTISGIFAAAYRIIILQFMGGGKAEQSRYHYACKRRAGGESFTGNVKKTVR